MQNEDVIPETKEKPRIKFKLYPWFGLEFKWDGNSRHQDFNLLPAIVLDFWQTREDGFVEKSWWFTIQFCWLVFGLTLDWRWE